VLAEVGMTSATVAESCPEAGLNGAGWGHEAPFEKEEAMIISCSLGVGVTVPVGEASGDSEPNKHQFVQLGSLSPEPPP